VSSLSSPPTGRADLLTSVFRELGPLIHPSRIHSVDPSPDLPPAGIRTLDLGTENHVDDPLIADRQTEQLDANLIDATFGDGHVE
jgi:hypothetical protein